MTNNMEKTMANKQPTSVIRKVIVDYNYIYAVID